ncbi:hypothetical protein CRU96_09320 [Malaciobacter halophilus]|nr:hypothetical protein [Malaciobacter halophilus]RYA23169.1 hypothetical protein CRU96_09320 [Malaciobacter halophilus]
MKEQYLDIISLINSSYYKENKRLNWHISQFEYDKLSRDVYEVLNNLTLPNDDLEVFNVCKPSIYSTLSSYLTHVYDYVVLQSKDIESVYSNESHIYIKNIWENNSIDSIFSIELEKKRFKKNTLKAIYSFLVKYFPKSIFDYTVASKNGLVNEFISIHEKEKFLQISLPYHFTINTTNNSYIESLTINISSEIFKTIEDKYFELDKEQKESIEFIISTFLARAYSDINQYNGFLKGCKSILTGTGNNYHNRLISTLAKKENIEVCRFYHGGDRCFYDDDWYWENEFFQTDTFVTYGRKWKQFAVEMIKNKNLNIKVKAIGSKYHQKIFDKYFNRKSNDKKKILYIPNSFVGEARQFPYAKIIDPLLFDWQKYLIETLQNNGFEVIYKKHPKGFFQEENILGKIAAYELTEPMMKALEGIDMVLCDMAGSAFVESLCAGKDIVIIDTQQRPFNENNKEELQKAVKIVEAYWEDNILKINEKKLIDTFRTININEEDKKRLIFDYFLNGDEND